MSRYLRDDRSRPRRRLASVDNLFLVDVRPAGSVREPRWPYPGDPVGEGQGGRDNGRLALPDDAGAPGVNGHPPASSVPARIDPARPASLPPDPVPPTVTPAVLTTVVGLTSDQCEQAIKLLAAGIGRAAVCEQLQITLRSLCEEIVNDPDFRAAVETAEEARINDCELQIYDQAMSGSTAAAVAFIKIKREHASDQARLKNETKVANVVAASGSGGAPNLAVLTNDEFFRFDALHNRLASGGRFAPDEQSDYIALMQKISMRPAGPSAGSGQVEARGLPPVGPVEPLSDEALFGVDEGEAG